VFNEKNNYSATEEINFKTGFLSEEISANIFKNE